MFVTRMRKDGSSEAQKRQREAQKRRSGDADAGGLEGTSVDAPRREERENDGWKAKGGEMEARGEGVLTFSKCLLNYVL